MTVRSFRFVIALALVATASGATPAAAPAAFGGAEGSAPNPPAGFVAIFDGESLDGWKGLVGNPLTRAEMSPDELVAKQTEADDAVRRHWRVEDGELVNDGGGPHLCTVRDYRDFELRLDWKITPGADSGIYLRGSPQVQIWDPVNGIDAARVGSGGLYNNQEHRSTPLLRADKPAGEWNTFHIRMIGERVTVKLNGQLVVDDVPMENYWDRARPIFPEGQIELQTHGGEIRLRNIYLREIAPDQANRILRERGDDVFSPLFNGENLENWTGSVDGYIVEDGRLICDPARGGTRSARNDCSVFRTAVTCPWPRGPRPRWGRCRESCSGG